jgi:hypothetical protein
MKIPSGILMVMALAVSVSALSAADKVVPADLSPSASDVKIAVPSFSDAVVAQSDFSTNTEVALTAPPASLATTSIAGAALPAVGAADVQQSHFRIAIYSPGSPTPQVVTDTSPQVSNNSLPGYAPMRYWGRYELRNGYIASVGGYGALYIGGSYGYSGNRGYSNYGYGGYPAASPVYIIGSASGSTYRNFNRAPVSAWYLHN